MESKISDKASKLSPNFCLVCAEPTNCCHYDVSCCNGCRIFFKRTITSVRVYGCDANGNCKVKGKNYCRQCRFDQCVRVGMNPAAVKFSKNINVKAVIRFFESRKRFLEQADMISPPSTSASPEIEVVPAKMASIKLPQPMEYHDVDFLLFLESKVRTLRESSFNPEYIFTSRLKELIEKENELGNADRYDNNTNWPITIEMRTDPRLENIKSEKKPVIKHWFAIDLILGIDMAKILPIFQQLAPIDKMPFITNVLVAISLLTQSYYSHEKHCEAITYPDGFTPLWLMQQREMTKLETEIFIRSVHPVKRIDLTKEEYVLIKAIIFCNPACENISDAGQRLLEQECERYSRTLLRYMQSIHGDVKGASRYAQVIAIMEAMAYFAERMREFHLLRAITRAQEAEHQGRKSRSVFVIDDLF